MPGGVLVVSHKEGEMNCPKCGKEMETGRAGAEPQYWWAGCDPCDFYASARTEEELKEKVRPPEKQEIKSSDVGKVEDIL